MYLVASVWLKITIKNSFRAATNGFIIVNVESSESPLQRHLFKPFKCQSLNHESDASLKKKNPTTLLILKKIFDYLLSRHTQPKNVCVAEKNNG